MITFSLLSADGKATTSGFDDLDNDSISYNLEGRVRTDFFGLTGHQLVGGIYSNKNFASMDQRLSLEPGIEFFSPEDGFMVSLLQLRPVSL